MAHSLCCLNASHRSLENQLVDTILLAENTHTHTHIYIYIYIYIYNGSNNRVAYKNMLLGRLFKYYRVLSVHPSRQMMTWNMMWVEGYGYRKIFGKERNHSYNHHHHHMVTPKSLQHRSDRSK
jgi:hypothetical protein